MKAWWTLAAASVAAVVAFGTGLAVGLPPIQTEKPRRNSWEVSALFPTPVIGAGVAVVLDRLIGAYWPVLGVVSGVFAAVFVKNIEKVFPRPDQG